MKRLEAALDRWVYKDEEEDLERPDLPRDIRTSLIERLGRVNDRSGYHRLFLKELEGLVFGLRAQDLAGPLKILDLGAGSGGLLRAIHRWALRKNIPVELAGVDVSTDFLKEAGEQLAAEGIGARLFQGDVCFLDEIRDESFDLVVSSYTVHHLRSTGKVASFFSEACRVARLGWLIADLDRRVYAPIFAAAGADSEQGWRDSMQLLAAPEIARAGGRMGGME